jgi:hypothetical protein
MSSETVPAIENVFPTTSSVPLERYSELSFMNWIELIIGNTP